MKSGGLSMATHINYVHFYVKFIQCNPVYRCIDSISHKSIEISMIIAESRKWSKIWSGKPWNNDWVCETAPCIHCSFVGVTMVWDGSVANTWPLEYQKSLQCWKTITILFNAINPLKIWNFWSSSSMWRSSLIYIYIGYLLLSMTAIL